MSKAWYASIGETPILYYHANSWGGEAAPLGEQWISVMNTIFAADHKGLTICHKGLISQSRKLISNIHPGLSGMLGQLESHLAELGARWYAGDQLVVDEFLQLYCIQTDMRKAAKSAVENREGKQ